MEKPNYQKQLDSLIEVQRQENRVPALLLHSCCAPCSSYVMEYLSQFFSLTLFYYNPNIFPAEEYRHRKSEQLRLLAMPPFDGKVAVIDADYRQEDFFDAVRGLESEKEGGERCNICYELRMRETAKLAKARGMDYFTTTLSVSPYKNVQWINEIGQKLSGEYGVEFLPSDFKKRGGYQRSIVLSSEYGLYRQHYCGCSFSLAEARQKQAEKNGPQD